MTLLKLRYYLPNRLPKYCIETKSNEGKQAYAIMSSEKRKFIKTKRKAFGPKRFLIEKITKSIERIEHADEITHSLNPLY